MTGVQHEAVEKKLPRTQKNELTESKTTDDEVTKKKD